MDEEFKASVLRKARENMEMKIVPHVSPQDQWEPAGRAFHLSAAAQSQQAVDSFKTYKAETDRKLNDLTEDTLALAKEAGATIAQTENRLTKRINELADSINELRAEIGTLRTQMLALSLKGSTDAPSDYS
jgi:hypothetical protein